jgi:hypothetical protein
MVKGSASFNLASLDEEHMEDFDEAIDKIESKLKPNVDYTIYLMDKNKNRTLSANRYYFGVVLKTISQHMGEKNLDVTIEDLHEVLKGKFNAKVVLIDGEAYEIGETTKKMTQDDFVNYVERIREWSLENLQCYIPEPQEVIKDDFAESWLNAYHNFPSK